MPGKRWQAIDKARKTLQLGEEATLAEIKQAYRSLSKRFHPDHAAGDREHNQEKMYAITAAYDLLMEYCKDYRFPLTSAAQADHDPHDPEDWWMERFGEHAMWGGKTKRHF
ncbi:MAG: molecular chaperone DnaJ [Desulfobulbus propionicus]|nr:MAG: molecular chaperone DnaJ [Desulfobulbus propionicus]